MSRIDTYLQECFKDVRLKRSDLHHYQSEIALPFLKENPFSALFVDMGLGKTIISLTLLSDLIDNFEFEKCLVIGPLRVVNQTWPTDIRQWEHTACLQWAHIRDEDLKEAVRKAGQAARAPIVAAAREEAIKRGLDPELDAAATREVINEFVKLNKDKIDKARRTASRKEIREASARNPACIHFINREQIQFLVEAWGRDWPYDCVIIDESSAFKDSKTRRFKALTAVRPYIKRMHQLTATPAAESYEHLFAQMYLLDGGKRLGQRITHYRDRYFIKDYNGFSYRLRPDADKEIAAKISDICLTLKKEDYLDMRDPVFNPRYVTLTPEQKDLYKQFERDYVVELDDGTVIEAETAAALSSKLLQLASGSLYDDEKNAHPIHNQKIEELQQVVEEAQGQPLLVAYWFQSSLARLKEAFPDAVVMDKAGKAVVQWNKGKIPMLLIHPASAGHGLNLQYGGHHLVFFDIPWSLELYQQTVGRLDRQGQKELVVLHHLITKGTVDELVVKALREKADMQEALFRYLKEIRKNQDSVVK